MAHIDAGKTTTTERILYYTGQQLQDRRGPRGRRHHGLDGPGAGAGHHHHLAPPPPASGATPGSTSSTPPATSTSPSRWSARCASSTAPSRSSTPWPASSPRPRRCGARPNKYGVPRMCFVNKMDRIGADFFRMRRHDPGPPRRHCRPSSSCRSGPRAEFQGVIDLLEHEGARLAGGRHGRASGRRRRDPRRPGRRGRGVPRHQLIDVLSNFDDTITEKYLGEEEITADDLRRALRTATIASQVVPVLCGSAFKNKGVQPMLDAVVDYLPSPLDMPPTRGHGRQGHRGARAQGRRRRAVLGAGLQDHDRPLRRQAHLRPGLLGHAAKGGSQVLNSTKDSKERVGPHPADARQPPRGQGRRLRRRHRRRGRPQADHHRRHPRATRTHPIVLEALEFPEPVIHVAVEPKTKADQDKLSRALSGPLRGGPHLPGPLRRGDRPDRHRRAWASCTSRCWSTGCCGSSGRRQRGQAPGGLPRDHPQAGREGRGALRPPDRRPGPVRPRGHRPRADRARRRLRVRRQDHRRDHPQGVHPLGRRRHPGGHAVGGAGRLPHGRRPGHPGRTAPTTTSTPRRWRSRSPARWLQEGLPAGPPGPARADHGRRGGHPRGLHGRRHRRPVVAAGQGRGHGAAGQLSQVVRAQVPLAEMFGYATDLRSRTQGRATYTMQFNSYQEVPESISKEIVARVRGE